MSMLKIQRAEFIFPSIIITKGVISVRKKALDVVLMNYVLFFRKNSLERYHQ